MPAIICAGGAAPHCPCCESVHGRSDRRREARLSCCTYVRYLMQGAQNVRCARCGHITAAGPQPRHAGAARKRCSSPLRGNRSCMLCNGCSHRWFLAAVGGQAQLVCSNARCQTLLTYPRGANQVQCSVCSTISPAQAVSGSAMYLVSCADAFKRSSM
jgi:LSD1 subclass zinc finger protein